jgi:2-hydroxychromene-2-carboxylate isomerase
VTPPAYRVARAELRAGVGGSIVGGMATPIEFWFDFSSGYAYFAALEIDALAARHGRQVAWRPYMLGAAFKVTGASGLSRTPLKGDYARHDWQRIARRRGVPFRPPPDHPIVQIPATRAYYWIERGRPDLAHDFGRAAFRAYFGEGRDLRVPEALADLAAPLGIARKELLDGLVDPEIKEVAKAASDEALSKNVFGSPFLIVDGEPFWGWDRLPMLEEWLTRGGW